MRKNKLRTQINRIIKATITMKADWFSFHVIFQEAIIRLLLSFSVLWTSVTPHQFTELIFSSEDLTTGVVDAAIECRSAARFTRRRQWWCALWCLCARVCVLLLNNQNKNTYTQSVGVYKRETNRIGSTDESETTPLENATVREVWWSHVALVLWNSLSDNTIHLRAHWHTNAHTVI